MRRVARPCLEALEDPVPLARPPSVLTLVNLYCIPVFGQVRNPRSGYMIRPRRAIGHAIAFIALLQLVSAVQQCSIGLKMYSVESGQTVCAPFSSYGCIEACEWNTSCASTTHFAAFKGRRTYVSGMILTSDHWMLQCCASLGTIVQMNSKHEPLCVWTSWVNSVEENGSVRMDPPLSKAEYIRDIKMERINKTGKVKLRLQICKFLTQRTQCDREKMPVEERHHYSLLLLRLYRTQLLLNATSSLSPTKKEEATSAAIRAAGTSIESRIRPASALFSVVSKVDEDRKIGNMHFRHSSTVGNAIRGAIPPSPPPRINTTLWDNQSGVPKARILPTVQYQNHVPTPPSSGFSIDMVPSAQRQAAAAAAAHRRRLATNATRQIVTKFTKAMDSEVPKAEESPWKSNLHIKKLSMIPHRAVPVGWHEGNVAVTPTPTTSVPVTVRPVLITTTTPFAIPLKPNYWQNANQHYAGPAIAPRPVPQPPPPPPVLAPTQPPQPQISQLQQIQQLQLYQRSQAMDGLLQCCQNQAPGCRQLCSKDIGKDEIKRALLTQQCPPLSMTSVIACFPQFYDTAPVATCCSASPTLPPQCLALCQPDFKPTLAHLSCIDHVSTIVECYRDLMR
uniref:DB domain-containing protein n=1 Tax=Panagrellus redivivus TaxID=6233 RepID=A0A7E4ZQW6_PANRE